MRGGRGGRDGRFNAGSRGGIATSALEHLRDTAEEMGLDIRAGATPQSQMEPLPAYPYIPLPAPKPLTEADGMKIQAQRELVHWWQQSVYFLRSAKRSATKDIVRYSDSKTKTGAADPSRGNGKKVHNNMWTSIHIPQSQNSSTVYIPAELLPPALGGGKLKPSSSALSLAKQRRARRALLVGEPVGRSGPTISASHVVAVPPSSGGHGAAAVVGTPSSEGKRKDAEDDDEEETGLLGEGEEDEEGGTGLGDDVEEDLEDDDYAMNHYVSDDSEGLDELDDGGDNEAIF